MRDDAEPKELNYGGYARAHYRVGKDSRGFPLAVRDVIEDGENLWRFSHVCESPRRGTTLRIAPALSNVGQPGGHQIISTDPLHIEPSILCEDCGIHGWVRNGQWQTV